jgi:hypothetical protein
MLLLRRQLLTLSLVRYQPWCTCLYGLLYLLLRLLWLRLLWLLLLLMSTTGCAGLLNEHPDLLLGRQPDSLLATQQRLNAAAAAARRNS